MFHEHERFGTLAKSNATLASILAGDELMNFILPLSFDYGDIGRIYTLGFCVLFIVCIQNVLIFIINESFATESEAAEKAIRKSMKMQNKITSIHNEDSKTASHTKSLELTLLNRSVVSNEAHAPEIIIERPEDFGKIKRKLFSNIGPSSKIWSLVEIAAQKEIAEKDVLYLNKTINDLIHEQIGSGQSFRRKGERSLIRFGQSLSRLHVKANQKTEQQLG